MSAELTAPQRLAVHALASGQTYEAAATAAGVSTRTLRRWRADPSFVVALREADADALAYVSRVLNTASRAAVRVFLEVLDDPRSSAALRLRAADAILRHRTAFFDLLTVSERLDALEKRIDEYGKQ